MKKSIVIILLLLLTGCKGNKIIDDIYSSEIDVELSTGNNVTHIGEYFPSEKLFMKYNGGFEGSGYSIIVEIVGDNKVQVREENTAVGLIKVYSVNENEIVLLFEKEEYEDNNNYLLAEQNTYDVILKAPIKVGTSWETNNGDTKNITAVDYSITTPSGAYKAIEITTVKENSVNKQYYAPKVGLVKSIYISDDGYERVSELIEVDEVVEE